MAKNIVICCDGTGNEIGDTISNVLKLYRMLRKDERQRVYYNPGVGTIGSQNAWQRLRQRARGIFGLATGHGLDDDVLGAYQFLSKAYEEGDKVWLFGFSRGAYTVRVLAAFLDVIGLLAPDQLNLAGYALAAYKKSSSDSQRDGAVERDSARSEALEAAWHFGQVAAARPVRVEFIGVWDTVASVIVPRTDKLFPDLQTLRFTRTNPIVSSFRHAMAIDERRRMFRLNWWRDPQVHRPNPYQVSSERPQDIRQVWFAGVHADVGGGYPEKESGLSKFPLIWMVGEATAKGLLVNSAMANHLAWGRQRSGSKHEYVVPDAMAELHDSMTPGWKVLEFLPKRTRWSELPGRRGLLGWYLPCAERRIIPEGATIHRAVLDRMAGRLGYKPANLPTRYQVEEHAVPPAEAFREDDEGNGAA